MNPTRRTLLGAAGAAALSRILLPWKPQPSDLLLADATPAAEPKVERVEVPPVADTASGSWFSLTDERGREFAVIDSLMMNHTARGMASLQLSAIVTDPTLAISLMHRRRPMQIRSIR